MTTTEFKTLMTRHLLGIADEDEEKVLQELLNSDSELGRIGAEFCSMKDFKSKYDSYKKIDEKLAFEKFRKVVNQETIVDKKLKRTSRWWNKATVRVAAALIPLFLLTTAIYYFYNKQNEAQVIAETEAPYTSVAPSVDNPLLRSEEEDNLFYGFEQDEDISDKLKTINTPRAGSKVIALEDGTRIHLNSCSSVSYPEHFAGNTREVVLKGEAYFEIAKNAEKPFIVHTATADVKQYGTQFNINAYDEANIKVTLVKGSIGVTAKGKAEKRLTPNQSALITRTGVNTFADDVTLVTEWMHGTHHFENESSAALYTTLQRMYAQNTSLTDETGMKLSGCINREDELTDVSDAINTITDEMPIESDRNPSDIQKRRVTLSMTNGDGRTFLDLLHKQTGISYIFNSQEIAYLGNIVIKAKNEPIEIVLKKVFTNTKFQYRFRGNVLTIKYNEYAQTTPPVLPAKKSNSPSN